MNKKELIDVIADIVSKNGNNLTHQEIIAVFEGTIDAIVMGLKNRQEINIPKFGKFSVQKRNARTGRNPQTGELINIPEANSAKFTVSKTLKDVLNT